MKVDFRNFKPNDECEVRNMICDLYREDPEGEPITDEKITKTLTFLVEHPMRGRILVFDIEGTVIGYSILIYYWSNEFGGEVLVIDELYVKPEWRGNRVSTNFFNHIFNQYKEKVRGFRLEVTPSNTRIVQHYKKLGFLEEGNTHFMKHVINC